MLFLLFLAVLQQSAAGQASVPSMQTSRPCSPVVANVVGDVNITCIGVDPRALEALNIQLRQRKLDIAAKVREANSWTAKYLQLDNNLREYKGDRKLAGLAEEYLHQGDLEKAGEILDQILAKDAADEYWIAASHFNLAQIYTLQFQPLKAIPELKKAHEYSPSDLTYADAYSRALLDENRFSEAFLVLEILPTAKSMAKEDSKSLPIVASMQEQMGDLYVQFRRYPEALAAFQEALDIRRQLAKTDPAGHREAGRMLDRIGIVHMNMQQPAEAEQAFLEALPIATESAAHPEDAASTEYHLAMLYGSQGKFSQVQKPFNDALKKYRDLAAENPAAFRGKLAETLRGAGLLSSAMNRNDDAEKALRECVGILDELGESNPETYLARRAQARVMLGGVEQARGEIWKAAALYDEAAVIYGTFDDEKVTAYIPEIASLQEQTGDLYKGFDMFEKALDEYQKALPFFRRLATQNPEIYIPTVARILENLAVVRLKLEEIDDARNAVDEALKIRRELFARQPARYGEVLAATLITKASVIREQHASCAEISALAGEASSISSSDSIAKGTKEALQDCGEK